MSSSGYSSEKKQFITRDTLANNVVQRLVRERGDDRTLLSDDELLASRRQLIPDDYKGDIWVFAYGSLLWNPVIEVDIQKMGRIYGYHRRFCLKTEVGRGSPGDPGLVLGLDNGGSCTGMALKIGSDNPVQELDLLWRREMLNSSYKPRMVSFFGDQDSQSGHKNRQIPVISFVMNHQHPSYIKEYDIDTKARMIATASGFAGPCRDYLIETHKALAALNITDHYINEIYKAMLKYS